MLVSSPKATCISIRHASMDLDLRDRDTSPPEQAAEDQTTTTSGPPRSPSVNSPAPSSGAVHTRAKKQQHQQHQQQRQGHSPTLLFDKHAASDAKMPPDQDMPPDMGDSCGQPSKTAHANRLRQDSSTSPTSLGKRKQAGSSSPFSMGRRHSSPGFIDSADNVVHDVLSQAPSSPSPTPQPMNLPVPNVQSSTPIINMAILMQPFSTSPAPPQHPTADGTSPTAIQPGWPSLLLPPPPSPEPDVLDAYLPTQRISTTPSPAPGNATGSSPSNSSPPNPDSRPQSASGAALPTTQRLNNNPLAELAAFADMASRTAITPDNSPTHHPVRPAQQPTHILRPLLPVAQPADSSVTPQESEGTSHLSLIRHTCQMHITSAGTTLTAVPGGCMEDSLPASEYPLWSEQDRVQGVQSLAGAALDNTGPFAKKLRSSGSSCHLQPHPSQQQTALAASSHGLSVGHAAGAVHHLATAPDVLARWAAAAAAQSASGKKLSQVGGEGDVVAAGGVDVVGFGAGCGSGNGTTPEPLELTLAILEDGTAVSPSQGAAVGQLEQPVQAVGQILTAEQVSQVALAGVNPVVVEMVARQVEGRLREELTRAMDGEIERRVKQAVQAMQQEMAMAWRKKQKKAKKAVQGCGGVSKEPTTKKVNISTQKRQRPDLQEKPHCADQAQLSDGPSDQPSVPETTSPPDAPTASPSSNGNRDDISAAALAPPPAADIIATTAVDADAEMYASQAPQPQEITVSSMEPTQLIPTQLLSVLPQADTRAQAVPQPSPAIVAHHIMVVDVPQPAVPQDIIGPDGGDKLAAAEHSPAAQASIHMDGVVTVSTQSPPDCEQNRSNEAPMDCGPRPQQQDEVEVMEDADDEMMELPVTPQELHDAVVQLLGSKALHARGAATPCNSENTSSTQSSGGGHGNGGVCGDAPSSHPAPHALLDGSPVTGLLDKRRQRPAMRSHRGASRLSGRPSLQELFAEVQQPSPGGASTAQHGSSKVDLGTLDTAGDLGHESAGAQSPAENDGVVFSPTRTNPAVANVVVAGGGGGGVDGRGSEVVSGGGRSDGGTSGVASGGERMDATGASSFAFHGSPRTTAVVTGPSIAAPLASDMLWTMPAASHNLGQAMGVSKVAEQQQPQQHQPWTSGRTPDAQYARIQPPPSMQASHPPKHIHQGTTIVLWPHAPPPDAHSSNPLNTTPQHRSPSMTPPPPSHISLQASPHAPEAPPSSHHVTPMPLHQPVITRVVQDSRGTTTPSSTASYFTGSPSTAGRHSPGGPGSYGMDQGRVVQQGHMGSRTTQHTPVNSMGNGVPVLGGALHGGRGMHGQVQSQARMTPRSEPHPPGRLGHSSPSPSSSPQSAPPRALTFSKAGVLRVIEASGPTGITAANLARQFGIQPPVFPHGKEARQLQQHLQSLCEDMDVYRKPSQRGTTPASITTGHVDIQDSAVCFAVM